MTAPVRLQLSRRPGFDLQALSRATNGLEAVSVARPSRWGNPYRVGPNMPAEEAVAAFRERYEDALKVWPESTRKALDEELRGRNLACWCPLDRPCHADVLLELANRPVAPNPGRNQGEGR